MTKQKNLVQIFSDQDLERTNLVTGTVSVPLLKVTMATELLAIRM